MDLWIIILILAAVIAGLFYVGYRSRKTRTLGSGPVIGERVERPTRPFDKR